MKRSRIYKRSVVIDGHKTSVSLEKEFWNCLNYFAREQGKPLAWLVQTIDADRKHRNLSSALRLFCIVRLAERANLIVALMTQPENPSSATAQNRERKT